MKIRKNIDRDYVVVPKKFLGLFGYDSAVLLCELVRKTKAINSAGIDLFYKMSDIKEEIHMSQVRQRKARERLIASHMLVMFKDKSVPPRWLYRIDLRKVEELLSSDCRDMIKHKIKKAGMDWANKRKFKNKHIASKAAN